MFDTHCHLNMDSFEKILEDTVNSARSAGVEKIIVPGIDIETSKKAVIIAEHFTGVYATCGIHPTVYLDEEQIDKSIEKLSEMIEDSKKVVAVGEIGLDYYRYKEAARVQKIYLEEQIKLAARLELPVIVHNRHAADDTISVFKKVLRKYPMITGVFHSMEANDDLMKFADEVGFYVGVVGDVTYDAKKKDMVKGLSLSKILLETDSPFQKPEPIRSRGIKFNQPKYLVYVAEEVSKIKALSVEEVVHRTSSNASDLFVKV
jgi:TatD DNase family protein